MRKHFPLTLLWLVTSILLCLESGEARAQQRKANRDYPSVSFACRSDNDLYRAVRQSSVPCARFDSPAEAVEGAMANSGLLILADGYPDRPTVISSNLFNVARKKRLRVYVEFPAALPGVELGEVRGSRVERAIVVSDFFAAKKLPRLRLMQLSGMRYATVKHEAPLLVAGRVAGFDTAVYGLPEETHPLLFFLDGNVLVGTTGFSHFLRARFAPQDAIRAFWETVLGWVADCDMDGLEWTPLAHASYGPGEKLPKDVQRKAVLCGAAWYDKANMITGPTPGDGSRGIREAVISQFRADGTQTMGNTIRGDCTCESAMALALAAKLGADRRYADVARRTIDYYLFESPARKNERANPNHGAYGLIAWGIDSPSWLKANYGDDNARLVLGTLATAAVLKTDRWDEAMMMCLLGNLRTTGKNGFRGGRIDVPALGENGWRHYFESTLINPHPHYECYLWACYLWAYEQTGYELFLDRAKTALRMTMERFPDKIRWTNGLAQEKARIVLPLAWLVRIEDTPQHREWLNAAVEQLLALQDASGAIREEIGDLRLGNYPPPQSNNDYGKHEASLIAQNGDPVADLLYTTNFAMLGLHEAAYATHDVKIAKAADRMADFLCRIQVRSDKLPQVDGGWFRAFDYKRWEPWASNADAGWGAWAIESGWTQGWIVAVLAMREMDTSLWELIRDSRIEHHFDTCRRQMIPD